jgi:DNA-binding GntR family transcriptional regulator
MNLLTEQAEPARFENLVAMPIALRVQEILRRAILNGALKPGQQLVETDLAKQMGISRGPLREAFHSLEKSGLVERVPHHGTFVTSFTERTIRELYGLRYTLESYALRLILAHPAAERAAALGQLEIVLGTMQAVAPLADIEGVNAADVEFHRTLVHLAGHQLLEEVWYAQEPNIWRTLALRNRLNTNLKVIVENHRPILDALAAGDLGAAEESLRIHIEGSGEEIVQSWRSVIAEQGRVPTTP